MSITIVKNFTKVINLGKPGIPEPVVNSFPLLRPNRLMLPPEVTFAPLALP